MVFQYNSVESRSGQIIFFLFTEEQTGQIKFLFINLGQSGYSYEKNCQPPPPPRIKWSYPNGNHLILYYLNLPKAITFYILGNRSNTLC